MKVNALVLAERSHEFGEGKDKFEKTFATVVDLDGCTSPMELVLAKADEDLKGTLKGRKVVIDIRELNPGYRGKGIQIVGLIEREKGSTGKAA